VALPFVTAWVKERYYSHPRPEARDSSDVRALVAIAMKAGVSEIAEDRRTSVLPRDDVLDLKRGGMCAVRKAAVFTGVSGTTANFAL
jgi:hypothetical protein